MLLINGSAYAGSVTEKEVRFYGDAPAYKGLSIVFESVSNYIIPLSSPIITMPINDDGDFDFIFPLSEPAYIFADLGRFRASIYIEPGKEYELVFPPFEARSDAERLNPHFSFEEVALGIANPESRDLNRNIIEFDAEFDYLHAQNAIRLFTNSDTALAAKLEQELDRKYSYSHPIFEQHKTLSFLRLRQTASRQQNRDIIAELGSLPVRLMPAYWKLFNSLFKGFYPYGFKDSIQTAISGQVSNHGSFDSIVDIAMGDTLFRKRELTELVILNGLYEAFYNKTVPENTILAVLQNAALTSSTPLSKAMALDMYAKTSMLRPGSEAPGFSLLNSKRREKSLSDYRGKFVYLNFIHTENYACQKDMLILEQFYKSMRRELEIVTIVMDEDFEAMENFTEANSYKWDFLHFGSYPQLSELYNLQALPSYYLINPEGTLSLSPAPAPEENFQERFAEQYQSFRIRDLRKNPPKEKSIFR